ncbi:glycosyl hydrolase 53 family protein [Sulfurimonas sp. MAG313]|nr:glycosyl hydrolase 53 family protein [Sulfurimonas sp. MAG313]MDF1880425.1 glycosyl hydrolase 53 family protein [Sulfurimonas sp. MAG313]
MTKNYFIFIVSILFFLGCGENSETSTPSNPDIPTQVTQEARILGMDVKEIPSVSYSIAYGKAMSLGIREVSVSLDWSLLEPSLGSYDNTLPSIIDIFYPLQTGDLTLVLRPLDTPGPSLPAELKGRSYDDPTVIAAFEDFLTNLHAQLPTLNASGKLKWIQIGNEIDSYLGNDSTRWKQWQTFFQAAKSKVQSLWGASIQVSSIVQFSVLNDPNKLVLYTNLLSDLDHAVLTYYPLNSDFTMRPVSTVATDFAIMVNAIPNKTIALQECGYPSSAVNKSSELQQADFITAVFEAWDKNINKFSFIDLTWQYDVSSSTLDQWIIDYGMTGNINETAFREYLGTLGFNNFDGTEKMAMQRLQDELKKRKWEQ